MQSVISRVLLPTLRIIPPPPPPSSFNGPGSQCRFPSSVPHCVTEPVKWGPCSYRDTSVMTHGAPLSGRIVHYVNSGTGRRWGEGESTKHRAASRSSVQRSSPARGTGAAKTTGFQRVTRPSSQNPGGGAAPAESGRSGPWPLGLSPELTSS